jgi:gliding motility associated protien GldN
MVHQKFSITLSFLFALCSLTAMAQTDLDVCWDVNYGLYPRKIEVGNTISAPGTTSAAPRKLVSLNPLTSQNVTFNTRVWSRIELKEKANYNLTYPIIARPNLWSLWNVIRFGLEVEQSITAYDPGIDQDDSFKYPLRPTDSAYCDDLKNLLYRSDFVDSLDSNGEPIYDSLSDERVQTERLVPVIASDIIKYYIKEDWFFDMERSVMEKRIIGIAPVINKYDEYGDIKGLQTLFWVYYPECELMFQNHIGYVRQMDEKKYSYTDLFRKRAFTSTIIKKSNSANSKLNSTLSGKDAIYESEKLRKDFDNMESDLWSY